jgi:ApbE superfamily uncharacterized protein (UPF0280 family)
MNGPQAGLLPDGRRLHLNHGPIDLVIAVEATDKNTVFQRAINRFRTILEELVEELPDLRLADPPALRGAVARRMQAATAPFAPVFITPMAAVAGSVADEVLAAMAGPELNKASVNNGGDIAFHLTLGAELVVALPLGLLCVASDMPWRGIATSGWRGRSHSLGIADWVTVLAGTAAEADAAATLIANAVDLPDHPAIARRPALALAPDSDLGDRLVTTGVGALTRTDVDTALQRGLTLAEDFRRRGLIGAACLSLGGQTRATEAMPAIGKPEEMHA